MPTLEPVTYWHTDAVFEWTPMIDVEPTEGWRMECDEEVASRLLDPQYNALDCIGTSRRLTRRLGASVSFTVYGSSLIIYGSVAGGPFKVRVGDGDWDFREPQTVTQNVLFNAQGLGSGAHYVTLASASESTELRNWTKKIAGVRDDSSSWTYSDNWAVLNNIVRDANGDADRTQTGMLTNVANSKATFKFHGNNVRVIGNMMLDHALFQVTLDSPESPILPASKPKVTFSSLSNYTVAEALMYYAGGLDPRVEQTLTIEVLDNQYFDLLSTEVYTGDPPIMVPPSPTPTPSPTTIPTVKRQRNNLPAIIGGVLGGLVVVIACVVLFYYLAKRNRRRHRVQAVTEIDPGEVVMVHANQDARPQPYSLTPDGSVPDLLPYFPRSSHVPTEPERLDSALEKRRESSGTSLPGSTPKRTSNVDVDRDHVQTETLPPAYSVRNSFE